MHKESIQVSDHFCKTQTFAYWNLRSNLRNKSHRIYYYNPKRHIPIFAMQFASQKYRKQSYLTRQKLTSMWIFAGKKWRRGRVFTNAALRLGMPLCPSLWVVFGTSFTRSAALRNFNGGSPTLSTTDWHLASFSSSAFRSRSDLPNSLAFLALASCSMISFSYFVVFNCTSD